MVNVSMSCRLAEGIMWRLVGGLCFVKDLMFCYEVCWLILFGLRLLLLLVWLFIWVSYCFLLFVRCVFLVCDVQY